MLNNRKSLREELIPDGAEQHRQALQGLHGARLASKLNTKHFTSSFLPSARPGAGEQVFFMFERLEYR